MGASWIGTLISAIAQIVASWLGSRREVGTRNNTPEILANQTSKDDVKHRDEIQGTVDQAFKGNEKSMEELRREASE